MYILHIFHDFRIEVGRDNNSLIVTIGSYLASSSIIVLLIRFPNVPERTRFSRNVYFPKVNFKDVHLNCVY